MNRGALRLVVLLVSLFIAIALADQLMRSRWGTSALSLDDFSLVDTWVESTLEVKPSHGSNRGGFEVTYEVILDTGLPDNPLQDAHNVLLQVHRFGPRGTISNLSWNITGYPPVSGSHYTYRCIREIPAAFIDRGSGMYLVRVFTSPEYALLTTETEFYFDDPSLPIYYGVEISQAPIVLYSIVLYRTIRCQNGRD